MYSSSKAALKGFTEALRVEFKGKCYVGLVCPGFTKTDIFRDQSNAGGKGQKVMDMISTDCDLMVKMIMFGIEHKRPMMVHGLDAHAMSIFNRLLPVAGSELFSANPIKIDGKHSGFTAEAGRSKASFNSCVACTYYYYIITSCKIFHTYLLLFADAKARKDIIYHFFSRFFTCKCQKFINSTVYHHIYSVISQAKFGCR